MKTDYSELLKAVTVIAEQAGDRLLNVYDTDARPADAAALRDALDRNERVSADGTRAALTALLPEARFVGETEEAAPLPDDGDWWVIDDTEGSVNHIHGLPDWGVSIALVRAGAPVLAVFRQPVPDLTYTAVVGEGAFVGGRRLTVSGKQGLDVAIVGTGQAEADQPDTYDPIGSSITALLDAALLVRASVPSTFPMLQVAGGNMDAFWQYRPVLPGVAAGSLFVAEAGGVVTTIDGKPWVPGSDTILVGAPGVHPGVRAALATTDGSLR
ncbi:MAG: inositol monophosphatase family protein [Gordonia amarae]